MTVSTRTGGHGRPRPQGTAVWWAVGALALSVLVVGLDSYVLVTALPTLSAELGTGTTGLQWITTAYTLATAGLLLPVGTLGDKVGRRRLLLAGLAVFGAASVLAGRADTAGQLIAMRAVMGAGGAVIMPMALAIVPVLLPGATDRRKGVALITVGAMLGLPLGPILAGWMLSHFAWGWIFLINGPVVVLALAGVWFLIPESADPGAPGLDWPGAALAAAGVMGVVYGIIQQPIDGWGPAVDAALAGGLGALVLFVLRQRRARSPLVDLKLFTDSAFTWGTAAFAVTSFALTGVLFVLTPYLQIVQGNSAQATGLRLLPMIGAMLAAAAVSERLAARLGIKVVIPAGMLIGGAGLAALCTIRTGTGYGAVAAGLVVFGSGLGIALPLAADAVLGTLPAHQTGMGNALSRTVQSVGIALGAAIMGSVLNNGYRAGLAPALTTLPEPERAPARAGAAGAHTIADRLPGDLRTPFLHAVDHAYLHGMTEALIGCTAVLAVGAVVVLLLLPGRTAGEQQPVTDPPDTRLRDEQPQASTHDG